MIDLHTLQNASWSLRYAPHLGGMAPNCQDHMPAVVFVHGNVAWFNLRFDVPADFMLPGDRFEIAKTWAGEEKHQACCVDIEIIGGSPVVTFVWQGSAPETFGPSIPSNFGSKTDGVSE